MGGVGEYTANEPVYVRWYQAAGRRETRRRGRVQRTVSGLTEVRWEKDGGSDSAKNALAASPLKREPAHCEKTYSALIRQSYSEQGYFTIAEGWRCGDGCADIVACDGKTLVFGFSECFPELPDAESMPWERFPGSEQSADIARAFLEEYRWYGIPVRFDAIACSRQREEEKILIRSNSASTSSFEPVFPAVLSSGALSSQ